MVPDTRGLTFSIICDRFGCIFSCVCVRLENQMFRCMEMSGLSGFLKAQLVTLAKACIEVVTDDGLAGSATAFRQPRSSSPPETQPGTFPPPETISHGWQSLREFLPEINDSIIISWLRSKGSLKGDTGRVLYRGQERVLDLGSLGSLFGAPSGEEGGLLWLKFT